MKIGDAVVVSNSVAPGFGKGLGAIKDIRGGDKNYFVEFNDGFFHWLAAYELVVIPKPIAPQTPVVPQIPVAPQGKIEPEWKPMPFSAKFTLVGTILWTIVFIVIPTMKKTPRPEEDLARTAFYINALEEGGTVEPLSVMPKETIWYKGRQWRIINSREPETVQEIAFKEKHGDYIVVTLQVCGGNETTVLLRKKG